MKKNKTIKTILAVTFVVSSLMLLSGCGCRQADVPKVDQITIWGLWDDSEVYSKLISDYRDANPNVKSIIYKKFPCNEAECYDYLREVVQGLAAGNGPDIFMINNTWVPAQKDKMLALDTVNDILTKQNQPKIMTLRDFGDAFVPIAKKDLVSKDSDGQERIYGVPLWIDTLAVFYNRDIFNIAGLAPPPKNWTWQPQSSQVANFESYASKMVSIDQYGGIKRSGAAMGYGSNINRAPDILAALMMQMGSPIVDPEWSAIFANRLTSSDGTAFSPGEVALSFFTKFSNKSQGVYTWNKEMHNSIDAFTEGTLGMMINYSNQIARVQAKAPGLSLGIAHLPQMRENSKPINFGSYWAFAVSKQAASNDQKAIECWKFLKFITDKDQSAQYSEKTQRVSPRVDLIEKQKEDQWLGVFADQALSADSFVEVNNARVGKIFEDAINSIRDKGVSPGDAANVASQQISQEGYQLSKKLKDGE